MFNFRTVLLALLSVLLHLFLVGCAANKNEDVQATADKTAIVLHAFNDAGLNARAFAHLRSGGGYWRTETGLTVGELDVIVFAEADPQRAELQDVATSRPVLP